MPVVKVDYYSVPVVEGVQRVILSATDKVSLPEVKKLDWGRLEPSGAYSLDLANGIIRFPMEYSRKSAALVFLAIGLYLALILLSVAVSIGFCRLVRADFRAAAGRVPGAASDGGVALRLREQTAKI